MGLNPWTRTSPLSLSYHAVAYGNGVFVAAGSLAIARSMDEGATWLNESAAAKAFEGVAYGGNIFVVVGSHTTSWAGNTWSPPIPHTNGGSTRFLRAITHGVPTSGALFVAVGDAGSIFTTPDGLVWTNRISPTADPFVDIAFGNQLFVAATHGGQVVTSPDGVTWTLAATVIPPLRKLAFGKNMFLGVDGSGAVRKSSNGATWTTVSTALANGSQMNSITFGFDVFAIVGPTGAIHTSLDGTAWTQHASGSAQHLSGIVYGRNRFIAVGAGSKGDIVRSGEFPSADLLGLTCSAGPLVPAFNASVSGYSVVGSAGSVTPTSDDPLAGITVDIGAGKVAVPSGTASAVVQVTGRPRTFQITVTARNGLTKAYTLSLHRTTWVTPIPEAWPFTWLFPWLFPRP